MRKSPNPNAVAVAIILVVSGLVAFRPDVPERKIFDVHVHGSPAKGAQLTSLASAGVYKACESTSWPLQQEYAQENTFELLYGLMLPCPNGKVPYSLQACYEAGNDYPDVAWVEQQIIEGKIDFLGEVLTQYYGISSSDSTMFPYYRLAMKYGLPVGIHTGSAGPDHGCPNFSEAMGNPALLRPLLARFPGIRVWIMHGGAPYVGEAISVMEDYPHVYADISAINFPGILPEQQFESILRAFLDAGLEDRIMFGSDNNDIGVVINSVERISFLSPEQKEKIFFRNAEAFFRQEK